MRVFVFLIALISFSLASVKIAYDRNNLFLEEHLNKITSSMESTKLVPMESETAGLYEMGQLDSVNMAVTSIIVLNGINQNDSTKLSKYSLITPLKTESIFIAVNKNSKYKSVYDLNNRNVNFGLENSFLDLFSVTLASSFNLFFNKYYGDNEEALNNMLGGNGLDAVVFSSDINSKLFQKYKGSVRFLSIPNIEGLKQKSFEKTLVSQEKDLYTVKSDLVLIAKKTFLENSPEIANKIVNQASKHISSENMCSTHINIISKSPYLIQACESKKSKGTSSKAKEPVKVLNLVKKIDSIEDIEIYLYAILKNKSFGGLNKETEAKKLHKVVEFFNEEKSLGTAKKILIKSYAKGKLGYQGGKKIFKLLQKKGISRGDMIIKSINIQNKCKDQECLDINSKVSFELF